MRMMTRTEGCMTCAQNEWNAWAMHTCNCCLEKCIAEQEFNGWDDEKIAAALTTMEFCNGMLPPEYLPPCPEALEIVAEARARVEAHE